MKVLIFNPPTVPVSFPSESYRTLLFSTFLDKRVIRLFDVEPLGPAYIASYLKQNGVDVDVLDACLLELDLDACLEIACKNNYDLIGISCIQAASLEMQHYTHVLRSNGFRGKILMGGEFASLNAIRILWDFPQVDFVIRGDGEIVLLSLIKALQNGKSWESIPNLVGRNGSTIFEGPKKPLNVKRDTMPWPERDSAEMAMRKSKTLGVYASTGCGYGECAFCSPGRLSNDYHSRWNPRDSEDVVNEVNDIWTQFKPDWISFIDTDFIGRCPEGQDRALDIFRGCREKGVQSNFIISCRPDEVNDEYFKQFYQYGLRQVFIGFESFVDRRLEMFNKGATVAINNRAIDILTDLGIHYVPGHIFFDPYVTYEDLLIEIEAYRKMDYYALHKLTKSIYVLPETPIWQKLLRDNLLQGNYLGYYYRVKDVKSQRLRESLYKLQIGAHPAFINYYKSNEKSDFSQSIRNTVKETHLEICLALYDAIDGHSTNSEVDNIVDSGIKQIADILEYPKGVAS